MRRFFQVGAFVLSLLIVLSFVSGCEPRADDGTSALDHGNYQKALAVAESILSRDPRNFQGLAIATIARHQLALPANKDAEKISNLAKTSSLDQFISEAQRQSKGMLEDLSSIPAEHRLGAMRYLAFEPFERNRSVELSPEELFLAEKIQSMKSASGSRREVQVAMEGRIERFPASAAARADLVLWLLATYQVEAAQAVLVQGLLDMPDSAEICFLAEKLLRWNLDFSSAESSLSTSNYLEGELNEMTNARAWLRSNR